MRKQASRLQHAEAVVLWLCKSAGMAVATVALQTAWSEKRGRLARAGSARATCLYSSAGVMVMRVVPPLAASRSSRQAARSSRRAPPGIRLAIRSSAALGRSSSPSAPLEPEPITSLTHTVLH